MKKVRVYELAKEAGMDSKVFTAKLQDLGYDVKAYNSTLDEEVAEEIRSKLFSAHTEVQEKRIQAKGRTTIIRRRTKSVTTLELDSAEAAQKTDAEMPADETGEVPAGEAAAQEVEAGPEASEKTIRRKKVEEAPKEPSEPEEQKAAEEKPEAPEESTDDEAAAPQEEPEEKAAEKPAEEISEAPEETVAEKAEDTQAEPSATESEAPESKEEKPAKPVVPEKKRTGLARVIKKSAIYIPQDEEEEKPAPRRPVKPKGRKPKGPDAAAAVPAEMGAAPEEDDGRSGKGKKGKRFVKFHHEGERGRKGGMRRKGYTDVDMEDVAISGGRFSSALRVDRGVRGGGKKSKKDSQEVGETRAIKKRIKVYDTITIADLAHRMGVKSNEVITRLMGLGVMATVNQSLDVDTATLVASDFGYEVEQGETEATTIINIEEGESGGEEIPRPPVVTVMGHVDHGKTSILDAIRNTDVAAGEAGGITQHIGAHYVRSSHGDVVFLDTPGHAAFTEMRSRGAKVTDVVVLVVAADDGVMDQTKEAINHAKAAEVPIVVAVNKIDKDDADPMRVKRELAEFGLVPEDWGGETIFCETSAKKNKGIDELLEQIVIQAEILELKADPKRRAKGRVVEAHLHKGRGAVATILVQQGTLKKGDFFVVGEHYGKVRSLADDKGAMINEAGPSRPVEVQGLSGVPNAGDEFIVVPDEKVAKSVSSERQMKSRETQLGSITKISLDNLFDKLQEGEMKELKVLLRADVQGTLEAFSSALEKLGTDAIRVKILHQGTGAIIDSDVLLAAASDAIIIGFNVRPSTKVADFAKSENVDMRYYDVIYHALDDIRKAMTGLLEPTFKEKVIGSVEVRDTFSVPKIGTIAGCYVTSGKIERNAHVRLVRDGVVVYSGKISSLKRFKDDAKEVVSGYECGVGLENYNDIKVGDNLEVYVMEEVEAEL